MASAVVSLSKSCLWARHSANKGCGLSWPVDPVVVNSGNALTARQALFGGITTGAETGATAFITTFPSFITTFPSPFGW
jgi:hypothetical protein